MFIQKILKLLHSSIEEGHSSIGKTMYRVQRKVFWPGLKSVVKQFVKGCDSCQRIKVEQSLPNGLLKP